MLEVSEQHFRAQPVLEGMRPCFERIVQYFRFLVDNERSLSLLSETGILPRSTADGLAQAMRQPPGVALPHIDIESVVRQFKNSVDPRVTLVRRAYSKYPPTLMDLVPLLPYLIANDSAWANLPILDTDMSNRLVEAYATIPECRLILFALYLAAISWQSERSGIAVLCVSKLHQQAVWAARDLFGLADDGDVIAERRLIQAKVGDTVIQRYLPDVDSMHFEDILELRTKCNDELTAFRIGLSEIAAQVDTTQPIERQRLQIEDVISTKVDPAVRNLEVALWSARADILKKVTPSWDSLARATVPFVISVAVGAPMNIQAALAAIGGFVAIAGPFIESEVDRRKLLHASQWTILLKLKKLGV